MNDLRITQGFDRGNYCAAYETQNFRKALKRIKGESPEYLAGFTLGFFSTYERHEMGEHLEAFEAAYASEAGQRCIQLGLCDAQEEEAA